MSLVPFTGQDHSQPISDVGVIVESEDGISLGHGLSQLVTVTLCHTPDGHYGLGAAGSLQVTRSEQRVNLVLLGRLDKTARVDHHRVRRTRVGHQREAIALQ